MREFVGVLSLMLLLGSCAGQPANSGQAASDGCSGDAAKGIFTALLAVTSGVTAAAQHGTREDAMNEYADALRQTGLDKDSPPCK